MYRVRTAEKESDHRAKGRSNKGEEFFSVLTQPPEKKVGTEWKGNVLSASALPGFIIDGLVDE